MAVPVSVCSRSVQQAGQQAKKQLSGLSRSSAPKHLAAPSRHIPKAAARHPLLFQSSNVVRYSSVATTPCQRSSSSSTGSNLMPASPFRLLLLLAALLLLACTAPAQCRTILAASNSQTSHSQYSSSSSLSATQQNVLNRMNYYRSLHGAAPLWWSKKLQDSADSWARRCVFQHSHWGYGENLAWNYGSWNDAIDAWYYEEKLYDYSRPQWSPRIGHFTQIVWKDTKAVGCSWSCQIYVCQYEPPGNVIGYFAQNVGRKKN